jgi:hypothetical protein
MVLSSKPELVSTLGCWGAAVLVAWAVEEMVDVDVKRVVLSVEGVGSAEGVDVVEGVGSVEDVDTVEGADVVEGVDSAEDVDKVEGVDSAEDVDTVEGVGTMEGVGTVEGVDSVEGVDRVTEGVVDSLLLSVEDIDGVAVDVVGVSTVLLSVEGVDKAGVELMVRPDDERGTHREASTPPPRARSGRAKILVLMTKRMRGEDNERRREREDAKPRFCKAEKRASTKSFTNKKEQQLKRNQAKKKRYYNKG